MTAELVQVTGFTVLMAAVATLVMLPPGVAIAWLLARREFPGRTVLETFVSLLQQPRPARAGVSGARPAMARVPGKRRGASLA